MTDLRARWEAGDDVTAVLVVAFADEERRFIARFDPETGLLPCPAALPYRGTEAEAMILWVEEGAEWGEVGGNLIRTRGGVTWVDGGTPWAVFEVEYVVLGVDVEEYIRGWGL